MGLQKGTKVMQVQLALSEDFSHSHLLVTQAADGKLTEVTWWLV